MKIRDTPNEELLMLYGARYAVSEMMKNASIQYARRLDDDFHFVEWQDIYYYLTRLINKLENERR